MEKTASPRQNPRLDIPRRPSLQADQGLAGKTNEEDEFLPPLVAA